MIIDNIMINTDLIDILYKLRDDTNLLKDIKDSNDNIMITCPYHKNGQERKPSAGILKKDGTFHCFTCGETHSFAEVISHCLGYNDGGVKGFNWLLKNYVSVSVENRKDINLNVSRETNNKQVNYVSEQELDSYRYYHPYMYERKLTNEIIEIFDIGFDENTKCITFPIRDINGNCLFIARRSVVTKYFNYPNSVQKPLYGIYEISKLDTYPKEIIVCESMLDALVCWVYGKYAIALNGLGSTEQFKELSKLPCRKLILATDNDAAGLNARKIIRENVKNHLITEYVLPNSKKDMNELSYEEFNNLKEIF